MREDSVNLYLLRNADDTGRAGMPSQDHMKLLRQQLDEIKEDNTDLMSDHLFVAWFLRAFVTADLENAVDALCGGPGDRHVDGLFFDDDSKKVVIVQGKFRKQLMKRSEDRDKVLDFFRLAPTLISADTNSFKEFLETCSPVVSNRLRTARERLLRRSYDLELVYATLGKFTPTTHREVSRLLRPVRRKAFFELFDGNRITWLLKEYLDGVAPPVPTIDFPLEGSNGGIQSSGHAQRLDRDLDIESWVFSMEGDAIGTLLEKADVRIFARNIRGFLGSTKINEGMKQTLSNRPHYFWYFNNGITILCTGAKLTSERGREFLRVENAQIINGQQTTRVLNESPRGARKASVLVRVISVRGLHEGARSPQFDALLSQIVEATNSQNTIKPSDLRSNDRRQIEIERRLRRHRYHYLRKRMTKSEARRRAGLQYHILKKDDLAKAVATCKFDLVVLREGKERLFEDYYDKIFAPRTSTTYYLSTYWMMRMVNSKARGSSERAYAKWLVLHWIWGDLGQEIVRLRMKFPEACRSRDQRITISLERVIELVFRSSLTFYRKNRGSGDDALAPSTFFKRKNVHVDFDRFWRGRNNKHRAKYRSEKERLMQHLAATSF